jgi:hypothetical protein
MKKSRHLPQPTKLLQTILIKRTKLENIGLGFNCFIIFGLALLMPFLEELLYFGI